MKLPINLALALKLVRRDWRSGELNILGLALIIAVAASTAVSLFGHRLTRTMETQAAEFLAADLVVSSHEADADAWFSKAVEMGLKTARTVEFPSVLVENNELLLTGAKAVSDAYPLRGALRTTASDIAAETVANEAPPPGTAWVDNRVLNSLKLSLGDSVTLGEKPLKLARIITHEPDRRGDLYSLSPRILFNLADLEATAVIRPGSNAHYYALFAGDVKAILEFKQWLKPLLHPGQKLVDIHEDRPELGNALSRAERYLGLSSIVIVLIAGVAIAMSARRYSERHYDLTALLKCMGAKERDVLTIHLLQYLVIGMVFSLVGCILGFLAQEGVAWWLKGILPHELVPPAWYAPLFGVAVGLFVLFGFALPPMLSLKRLPPLRVLRRDLAPMPSSAWTVYGLALVTLSLLVWRYTGDGRMTAIVLGIALATLGVAGLLVLALLKALRRLIPLLGLSWRFGLQNLTRRPRLGMVQILAFGLTATAMLVSLLVRTELIQEWQRQLPPNAPNYFALNLFEGDLPAFREFLSQHGIFASDFYPIVRGRFTEVNGVDVHTLTHKDSQGEGAANRDLSLTWSEVPPTDNRLTEGEWWGDSPASAFELGRRSGRQEIPPAPLFQREVKPGLVSVEAKLAESLQIKLGDKLGFSIDGQKLDAVVVSLRSVRWDTMRPNFYMIFSPGTLNGFPARWLTSFYCPQNKKADLVGLAKRFPAVTLLEVDQLLKQFQTILKEISLSIDFVLTFALAAGFAVLFASVRATLDERLREDALLRAMGASRSLLRKSLTVEFATLGLLSGLLAAAATEAIAWALFSKTFELHARFHWQMWILAPLAGILAVGVSGYIHTRGIVRSSPVKVLREV
ncbi:MAG: ABC transporter permease [Candidatus Methylumidiphilus alinenensis]|uniref:ABC transporter permease n=1 Tax=Candidatus Methylumidiphilus alinenensis TaxID=2202197 RepID=A0A2W4QPN1_9GAMM|nr:MAG: ABC transporter permease [Candidatus Methylumidiphilus alinenensis]